MANFLTLLLVALSIGLDNFAASVAIGTSEINNKLRRKVALVFGGFGTAAPIIGLLIGQKVAGILGNRANFIGGGLLVLVGIYLVYSSLKKVDDKEAKKTTLDSTWGMLLAGISVSVDNLIVGFSLGAHHISLLLAIIIIGILSVALALAGLEIGRKLSSKFEEFSEIIGGVILLIVGLGIVFKIL